MSDKVLFLDFDGVLNSTESIVEKRIRSRGVMGIDPYHVAKLQRVVDETGAVIVVSSTWRKFHSVGALGRLLRRAGFRGSRIVGVTPDLSRRPKMSLYIAVERGYEIDAWLKRHRAIEHFAIVDDDSDAGVVHPHQFVKTSFDRGLQDEHAEKLITILGRRQAADVRADAVAI